MTRVLVAGIGNIFLGDDGFGVEVVRRLAERRIPDGVEIVDFGIRGMDLAYALLEPRDAVILIDAAPRGQKPGTVSLIEHEMEQECEVSVDTHSMDPVKVLRLAQTLGAPPTRVLVIAVEPGTLGPAEGESNVLVQLSDPVKAAVNEALVLVESLLADLISDSGDESIGIPAQATRRCMP